MGLGELVESEAVAGGSESEVQDTYRAVTERWAARPSAADALFHLAQSYQRAGQIELAATAYDELLQRPDSVAWRQPARRALETLLRSLSATGKNVEVANLFFRHENLLTTPAVHGPTGLVIAAALTRLELIDPAIALIHASLAGSVSPVQHEYGLVALAEVYRKKGDQAKLEWVWNEYLRRNPKGAWAGEAREGLIIAYSRRGNPKEGEKACRALLAIGTGNGASSEAISLDVKVTCADLFVSIGQPRLAEPLYRELLKVDSDDEDARWASYQIAQALQLSKRPAEATEFFGRAAQGGKDPVLAGAAVAQLTSSGPAEKP
jgi:tetratricopeptide (TPR) repeat protein